MRIPSEITIDGVVYNTAWMVTSRSSFVEQLEILISKVIYITLEKCTADVSNRDKDEIRHLLAKNLALFLNNYADVIFNKDPEFIPDKLFLNGKVIDIRYTDQCIRPGGKLGPHGILLAVIRRVLDGQFENLSFANKSTMEQDVTIGLRDFFEKNKESLFNNSASLPDKFSSAAHLLSFSHVQDNKNSGSASMAVISMSDISQLISDMRAGGAPKDELSRAINHSVAVITAEKAILDRDASFSSNDIMELFKKYHR